MRAERSDGQKQLTGRELEAVRRLLDEREISAVQRRYCRGLNRLDRQLLLSVYHEDGVHRTASGVCHLSPEAFVEEYWHKQATVATTMHYVTNATIEIDGDTAHAESYFLTVVVPKRADSLQLFGGRYVDRLEQRDGCWRIAVRCSLGEWHSVIDGPSSPTSEQASSLGTRDQRDLSYLRPLLTAMLNGEAEGEFRT